ncbi:site-specific integrase [Anaerotignum sp.]
MPVYKDSKRGTWYVKFQYKDWKNENKTIFKRGFSTKKDAFAWERDFILQQSGSTDMSFADFVEVYKKDREARLKESTFETKQHIIDTKIVPYFGSKKLRDITSTDIIQWQNMLLRYSDKKTGKPYSRSYLKTVHNQMSAIFNHAVKFYGLKENPAKIVGNMGSEKDIQMKFWTNEEYKKFSEAMMDIPLAYYCFQVLYWGGLREGELLALCPTDINFDKKIISITKTYHRYKKRDIITSPKTPKSKREVVIPDFLCSELQDYMNMCYDQKSTDRLFPVSKNFLTRMMKRGTKKAGLEPIRIHDLRHSHVSLLIDLGYNAISIAQRVGHESIDITFRYAHLFPTVQSDMADKLNSIGGGDVH